MRSLTKKTRVLALSLVCVSALTLFAANAGTLLVIDKPERSDVIVVLAGETRARPARALELLSEGYAQRLVLDVPADSQIFEFSELQLAQKYVRDLPQAASIAICPIKGLSTKEESHDVAACLSREQGSRVLIVTSDFHTRRSLSIFRREVGGKSFSVAAAGDANQFGTRWWTHRQWAKTCFDEWTRLFWWNAVERWIH